MIKFISGILLDFLTILFCYFIMRLVGAAYNSFFHANFDTPYTYTIFWIGIIFLIPYLILKRRGLNQQKLLAFLIGVVLIGGLSVVLTKFAYGLFTDPDKFEIVNSNYVGISGEDEIEYETLMEEGTRIESIHGLVFLKKDRHIFTEKNKTQNEHEDASLNKYIFWQSAMADGYDPKNIPEYKENNKTKLIFTVAPLRILESFIDALIDTFLFLIVPIIMRGFGKSLIFSDFSNLLKFIRQNVKK